MAMNQIEKSRREYQLSRDKQRAYNKLGTLLSRAESEGLHSALGLPEKLRAGTMKQVRNHRAAVTLLLQQHLESAEEEGDQVKKNRELIKEILEGIQEVERIEDELRALEEGEESDDDPTTPTPPSKANGNSDKSAA